MLGNTSVDAVGHPPGLYPPVISRTLSPRKRNLLLEEQLLTQSFVFVKFVIGKQITK